MVKAPTSYGGRLGSILLAQKGKRKRERESVRDTLAQWLRRRPPTVVGWVRFLSAIEPDPSFISDFRPFLQCVRTVPSQTTLVLWLER